MRSIRLARHRLTTLIAALLLAGCGGIATSEPGTPSGTSSVVPVGTSESSPSPLVSATETPSPLAMPTPGPSVDPLISATSAVFLASTVDGLRLRTGPAVAEAPFVFQCNPVSGCNEQVVMNAGWRALALAGPVAADGYDWYLVQLDPAHPGSAHLGWAATPQPATRG